MPQLTKDQQEEYVRKGGVQCPFCFSENVCSDNLDADGSTATAEVTCNNCFEEWTDIYTLTGVVADKSD